MSSSKRKSRGDAGPRSAGAKIRKVSVEGAAEIAPAVVAAQVEDDAAVDVAHAADSSFAVLGLRPWLDIQCRTMGFRAPTPVQVNAIPAILAGHDCIACAKTGSGKTAAFVLPILQTLAEDPYGVFALVITPTRELAFQISDQFRALGRPLGLRQSVIVGGFDMMKQGLELQRRPHVVIATPGRLADHLRSNDTLKLSRTRYLVLDEADRLLSNASLQSDLQVIMEALPASRQMLLFSATMPSELAGPIAATLRAPVFRYAPPHVAETVATLKQQYIFVPSHVRHAYFVGIMRTLAEGASCLVFTSTCRSCEELALILNELDIECVALHSRMSQFHRLEALSMFKSGHKKILVATDVAGRGIDIPTVRYVINFNVPKAVEDFIHRVGRTARAGRGGVAITCVSENDIELVHAIEARTGVTMSAFPDLDEGEVLGSLTKVNLARRAASIRLQEMDFDERDKRGRA